MEQYIIALLSFLPYEDYDYLISEYKIFDNKEV